MPQDEPDLHNFSTSPDTRLPPINGAEALQNEIQRARGISTGLPGLDSSLSPHNFTITTKGIQRGYLTEIYGPPGSGKTTFGIQVAVNAIKTLGKVVWICAGPPLMQSRLNDIKAARPSDTEHEPPSSPPDAGVKRHEQIHDLVYQEVQSLSHLLVMLMHSTTLFPPPNTAVIILDGLPNILMSAFPRQVRGKDSTSSILRENAAKSAAGKRHHLIENLVGGLSRLATSRHIAVVILNKTTTSMRGSQRAILKPAIGGQAWDAAIYTRIVLYRDLYPRHLHTKLNIREKRGYRLAEVVRLGSKDVAREPVPFVIETAGLRELATFGEATGPSAPLVGAQLVYDPPLQIRTSQPETRTTVPLITQDTFPTASQVLRNERSQSDQATPIPIPLNLPAPEANDEPEPTSSQPRPPKRKATEIADSEDEDEDEVEDGAHILPTTTKTDAATMTLHTAPRPPLPFATAQAPTYTPGDQATDELQEAANDLVDQAREKCEELSDEDAEEQVWKAHKAELQRWEAIQDEAHLLVNQYADEGESLSHKEAVRQIIELRRTGEE